MKHRLLAGGLVLTLILASSTALAAPPANRYFDNTWQRTDRPVAEQQVSRTWMWGPDALTGPLNEPYTDAPGLFRTVQYFDKSRMEITYPADDPNSIWYVTNGLLAQELITGRMQFGDAAIEHYEPAEINVAGDSDDPDGPTYASFQRIGTPPLGFSEDPRITRISRDGTLTDDPSLAEYDIYSNYYVIETNHRVAEPFWEFMNSSGPVYSDGVLTTAPLFPDPFFATGFPISEAYWANVKVGGQQQEVLIQCFERRCLTYTPGNPEGFEVEAGNIGQHYYEWRYVIHEFEIDPQPYPDDGDVRITFILFQPGSVPDAQGEYVNVANFDDAPIDLTGWALADNANFTYQFPDGFVLGLDATVRVHICDGEDSATDLYWGRCAATWNNTGDTGRLINPYGDIVHEYSY
ncbi:hypothetical protein BH23CHL2_BH23CHL2_20710 [soil metagenome]